MKFYTDPEFFFNIWCNELMKDNETRKIEKKRRRVRIINLFIYSVQTIEVFDWSVNFGFFSLVFWTNDSLNEFDKVM